MKLTLLQLASLAVLSLFSCAEVGWLKKFSPSASTTNSLIPSCLEDVFSSEDALDNCFKEHFPSNLSVKTIFKEHFDVPELVTDDVDENENELKFLLLSYSMLKNPQDVFEAFLNEFLDGNSIHVLLPNLLEYFNRIEPYELDEIEIKALFKHKQFDYLFQRLPNSSLFENHERFFLRLKDFETFQVLQEYLVTRPDLLESVKSYYGPLTHPTANEFVAFWIKVALVSNMPDSIFRAFPRFSSRVFDSPCVWSGILVQEKYYPEVFERINYLIDNAEFEDYYTDIESHKEELRLNTLIRYGPEDPNVYEEKIANLRIFAKLDLCHFASLANKMDLFRKLLPGLTQKYLKSSDLCALNDKGSIEMHKFLFNVHQYATVPVRQFIYDETRFVSVLSRYYRVANINRKRNYLKIDFKIAVIADNSVFPELLTVNWKLTSDRLKNILKNMTFDNAEALEIFLVHLFTEFKMQNSNDKKPFWNPESILSLFGYGNDHQNDLFSINLSNLNLILRSESIRILIYKFMDNSLIQRQPFHIDPKDLLLIDPEFDSFLIEIAKINRIDCFELSEFKTAQQLQRIETFSGRLISTFLSESHNYITYRHVYKYVIENHQELPRLSEKTRKFMRIDFPTLNI